MSDENPEKPPERPPIPDFGLSELGSLPIPLAMAMAHKRLVETHRGISRSARTRAFGELTNAINDYVRATNDAFAQFETARFQHEALLKTQLDLMDWSGRQLVLIKDMRNEQLEVMKTQNHILKAENRILQLLIERFGPPNDGE